jgi:hypothetical protein
MIVVIMKSKRNKSGSVPSLPCDSNLNFIRFAFLNKDNLVHSKYIHPPCAVHQGPKLRPCQFQGYPCSPGELGS